MFFPELPLPSAVLVATGRTVTVSKPDAGSPVVYRLEPGDTLNLQPIVNESITLVKLGNRLVVLFPDRGFIVLDGLYLADGNPSSEVNINFAPDTTLNAVQFTSQFPITTDTEILTAAGINVGPLGSGGINLAEAPPGSALQPLSDLTPNTEINGREFGDLPPSSFAGNNNLGVGGTPPGLNTPIPGLAAVNDAASVTESGVRPGNSPFAGSSTATGSVISNDIGAAPLTLVGVEFGTVGAPITGTYGTVTLAADGSFAYTLNNADPDTNALSQGQSVREVFTYTVRDSFGQISTAQLVVTIAGTNDAPVITTGTLLGTVTEAGNDEGGPFPGIAVATGRINATDVDNGAVLRWSGNARGVYGDFVVDPLTGRWTYTLDNADPETRALRSGDSAREQFTITVTDEFGATAAATVAVTVLGSDDGPALDLDTTTPGVNYRGLAEAEAARSTNDPQPGNGVSIIQSDDGNPPTYQFAADAAGGVREVRATISDTATGRRGRLNIDMLQANPDQFSFTDTSIAGDTFAAIAGGGPLLTQQQVDFFLENLRFINNETTFALDTSDREIVVTLVDANGFTYTATAFIPVIADVIDTTGLNAFTGTSFGDTISGLGGDDVIDAGDGNNIVDGGTGDNRLTAGIGNDRITAAEGDDTINAGDGDNTITAGDGDNAITAGSGNDSITAGSGDDIIDAGNGNNTIAAGDGDNQITTGSGIDIVTAGNGDNLINAGGGNDRVTTGAGDDRINLGSGNNRVTSGSGADTLVFDTPLGEIGLNTITDFETGFDVLELDFSVFGAGLATGGTDIGTLDGSRFVSGTSFANTTQRFLFDTSSNTLFFDADGSGAGSSVALAQLESGTVAAADIHLA